MTRPTSRFNPQVSQEVALQVADVESAAQLRLAQCISRHEADAAQAEEAVVVRAGLIAQHPPHGGEEFRAAGEDHEDSAQVVAVDPIIAVCLPLELVDATAATAQFVQPAANEIWLAADQAHEPTDLRLAAKGAFV